MSRKKVKVELCTLINSGNIISSRGVVNSIGVLVFYCGDRYFFFSKIPKKGSLKRCTWAIRLIHSVKPLIISEKIKKEGCYKYREVYISAYLMRRLLDRSNRPETFNELENYEVG